MSTPPDLLPRIVSQQGQIYMIANPYLVPQQPFAAALPSPLTAPHLSLQHQQQQRQQQSIANLTLQQSPIYHQYLQQQIQQQQLIVAQHRAQQQQHQQISQQPQHQPTQHARQQQQQQQQANNHQQQSHQIQPAARQQILVPQLPVKAQQQQTTKQQQQAQAKQPQAKQQQQQQPTKQQSQQNDRQQAKLKQDPQPDRQKQQKTLPHIPLTSKKNKFIQHYIDGQIITESSKPMTEKKKVKKKSIQQPEQQQQHQQQPQHQQQQQQQQQQQPQSHPQTQPPQSQPPPPPPHILPIQQPQQLPALIQPQPKSPPKQKQPERQPSQPVTLSTPTQQTRPHNVTQDSPNVASMSDFNSNDILAIRAKMPSWSVADVVKFIESHEDIRQYSSKFADDEMDGKALLLMIDRNLNFQILTSMFKHGPAMKIEAALSKYKITIKFVLGTLYPAYKTWKSLKRKDETVRRRWMKYWISFSVFQTLEYFADFTIAFVMPFYVELKISALMWLVHMRASSLIDAAIDKELKRREKIIDGWLRRLHNEFIGVIWFELSRLSIKVLAFILKSMAGVHNIALTDDQPMEIDNACDTKNNNNNNEIEYNTSEPNNDTVSGRESRLKRERRGSTVQIMSID